jgi:hypothetical protein
MLAGKPEYLLFVISGQLVEVKLPKGPLVFHSLDSRFQIFEPKIKP